jgi:hypothetical protein
VTLKSSVDAVRFLRKMRGGAQAHLLEANDGRLYVVKFKNNPQHRRILLNEWIAHGLSDLLGISTPAAAVVRVTPEFLEANPGVSILTPAGTRVVSPGLHFGSRYAGQFETAHDILPTLYLKRLKNARDFIGSLILDLWLSNSDRRQAVFTAAAPGQFTAWMIDNGNALEGGRWKLSEEALAPVYFNTAVYERCWSAGAVEEWLDALKRIPARAVRRIAASAPREWVEDDDGPLERLLDHLLERRRGVRRLVEGLAGSGLLPALGAAVPL